MIAARISNRISLILLIVPLLFLLGVLLKHYLQIDSGLLTGFYTWAAYLDARYGDESVINWVIRLLLVGGPIAIVIVNLLAVSDVTFKKPEREVQISIKLNWKSLLLLTAGSIILIIFLGYLFAENLVP